MKIHNDRPLTTPDGEVRDDLTDEELARFRPASGPGKGARGNIGLN